MTDGLQGAWKLQHVQGDMWRVTVAADGLGVKILVLPWREACDLIAKIAGDWCDAFLAAQRQQAPRAKPRS
jgi:hypothetical protein